MCLAALEVLDQRTRAREGLHLGDQLLVEDLLGRARLVVSCSRSKPSPARAATSLIAAHPDVLVDAP